MGWTTGPDRFAYAAIVGVGTTRQEGYRRANLAADYLRTAPVVLEPFANLPLFRHARDWIHPIRC